MTDLADEARYLHRCFFAADPPPVVIERYIAANRLCCPEPSPLLHKMTERRLDAEAVELALRLSQGRGPLTTKIQILFYLLEVRSAYYPFFAGAAESRPIAVLGLLGSLPQTAVKYLKGAYLIRRHGLV